MVGSTFWTLESLSQWIYYDSVSGCFVLLQVKNKHCNTYTNANEVYIRYRWGELRKHRQLKYIMPVFIVQWKNDWICWMIFWVGSSNSRKFLHQMYSNVIQFLHRYNLWLKIFRMLLYYYMWGAHRSRRLEVITKYSHFLFSFMIFNVDFYTLHRFGWMENTTTWRQH